MKNVNRWLLATALLSVAMVRAQAGIVTFTDRSAFLAALGNSYDEAFNAVPGGNVSSPDSFTGGSLGFTVSAGSGLFSSVLGADRFLGVLIGTDDLHFGSFAGNPNAVGGILYFDDGTGANIAAGAAGLVTVSNGVDPNAVVVVTAPSSATGFFGFISTSGPITSLVFSRTTGIGTGFADSGEFIVGTAAPEPGTIAMMTAGLAGLLEIRRKRR